MSGNPKAAAVRFQSVTKRYGSVIAVDNIDLEIPSGELVTLLGPSGCGKTTTLRLIAGLEMASTGKIFIGDQDVTDIPVTDRDVSMVFQSYALFPHMTVSENVSYGLRVTRAPKAEMIERTEETLALVGLEGYGSRMPSELSGGQQQRVAVARALILRPQVLLFDEPLSNLDAKLRRRVRDEIREIQQKIGLTTVYVTHDQEEALAVSDQIVVMNNAVIAQQGSPRQLYETPADVFVADFIGEANIVDGEVLKGSRSGIEVKIGAASVSLSGKKAEPGPAHIAIRPDAISVSTRKRNDGVSGKVTSATYLGSHIEYSLETDIGNLYAVDHKTGSPIKPKTEIGITFNKQGVIVIQD
ncbi:MAG: ABC transporter ATP-binding protein [Rhizobiaceae bacterium]